MCTLRWFHCFFFRSHEIALTKGLLEGYKIHVTKKVKPEPSQMKGMSVTITILESKYTIFGVAVSTAL